MASNKEWLKPGSVVEHKVFGESEILHDNLPSGWVKFKYKILLDNVKFEWSAPHSEHERYFMKPTK